MSNIKPTKISEGYHDLVRNLVAKDIKVRYMGTALGFAWSLTSALSTILIYMIVFTYIFRSSQPNHALFLITGILHWIFFAQLIGSSSNILVSNAGLIKKIYFPRIVLTISNLLVALILWLSALTIYLIVFPFLGGHFSLELLAYPFFLALFVIFAWGLSLILSTLYVDFRDLKHLVEVALQILFWSTPILYPLTFIPDSIRIFFLANPVAEFIIIFQGFFYGNQLPSLEITLAVITWTTISVSLGLWIFYKRVPNLVERL